LILPGIGTAHDLKRAYEIGVRSVRVATHCTEADVSAQHIATARELGMDVSGFLMMSQLNTPEGLAQQAKMMESDGANCVYVVDSGGRLTMDGIKARVRAYRDVIDPSTEIGVHAQRTSRSQWPTAWQPSKRASPAWTPRSPGWVPAPATAPSNRSFVAVADLTGWEHSADLFALQDAADDLVRPLMDRPVRVDRETLTLGYAGVYSSFLRHAETASATHGVDVRRILTEVGARKLIGGQEDQIIDIALDLSTAADHA
jgi:4-hydroxy 2-oxovalerate aldolase